MPSEKVTRGQVKLVWTVVGVAAALFAGAVGFVWNASRAWASTEASQGELVRRVDRIEERLVRDDDWRRTVDSRLDRILCAVDKEGCLRR